jgi:Domain of unknown function (DUF4157)
MYSSALHTKSSHTVSATAGTVQRQPFFQRKLSVNQPGDTHEQEADRVADAVVQRSSNSFFQPTPANHLQRKCAACEHEQKEKEELQRKPLSHTITPVQRSSATEATGVGPATETAISHSKGSGQLLDPQTRQQMESSIGADFSGVKIHTGNTAVQLSRDLNARAFTSGSDIYFNSGEYNPSSKDGQHLLAHELTHVVQQGGGNTAIQRTPQNGCTRRTTGSADPDGLIEDGFASAVRCMQQTIHHLDEYLNDRPDGWFRAWQGHALNVYFNCPSVPQVRTIRDNIQRVLTGVTSHTHRCSTVRRVSGENLVGRRGQEFTVYRNFFDSNDSSVRMGFILKSLFGEELMYAELMSDEMDPSQLMDLPAGSPLHNRRPSAVNSSYYDYANRPPAQYLYNANAYVYLITSLGCGGNAYTRQFEDQHTPPCELEQPTSAGQQQTPQRTPRQAVPPGAVPSQDVFINARDNPTNWSFVANTGGNIWVTSYHLPGRSLNFIIINGRRFNLNNDREHTITPE